MDVRLLKYLLVVEQEGNISRAAERIHISQSALSQNLSRLEKELQTPVFTRRDGRLVPTAAGKCYLDGAREMVRIQEDTYKAIAKLACTEADTVRIALCPQVYAVSGSRIISALKRDLPSLRFEFHKAESALAVEYLFHDVADAAILSVEEGQKLPLPAELLYRSRILLAIPSGLPAPRSAAELSRLSELPFILPGQGTDLWRLTDQAFKARNLRLVNPYHAREIEGIRLLMEHGYGAALLPERMLTECADYRVLEWDPPLSSEIRFAVSGYVKKREEMNQICSILRAVLSE